MSDLAAAAPDKAWPNWFGPVLVLLGGICIGFAPIGLRLGTDGAGASDLGPQGIAFWRYVFALPILFMMIAVTQKRLPAKPNPYVIIAGVCFAVDIGLWHWSLTLTTVANSTFIVNLGNICVGLTAWVFLKERPTSIWAIAVVIAISGAAALSLGGMSDAGDARPFALRGDLLAFGAAILVSCYMVASKVARRSLGGLDTIFWLTAVEIVTAGVLITLFKENWFPADMSGFVVPLFLALIVQVAGQGLIITGLGHTPASVAGVLIVVQPVVAAAISWRLFGEVLVPLQIGGCLFILFGILLAQAGHRKSVSKPSQSKLTSFVD